MRQPELLLISPKFHGYWKPIADALVRRGYDVATHLYDQHHVARRVQRKVTNELPKRLGLEPLGERSRTAAAITRLRAHSNATVLIVKGDSFDDPFWAEVSARQHTALWLYDELRRTAHRPETLGAVSGVASYSRQDVQSLLHEGITARYVPLGFDTTVPIRSNPHAPGVVFVGARYSSRESILRYLMANGVAVKAFGRDWSDRLTDRLRTWRLSSIGIPNGPDLDRATTYAVMASYNATLNTHFNQDGFTMRTFEAAGVGAVQLIDRPDVADLYEPDTEIAVFRSPEEAVDLARRAQRDTAWANRIRENGRKRTLAEHTFDHRIRSLEALWQ